MHYLVIYDIPDDRLRTKVADICLDYGLDRIQYSAFVGRLTRGQCRELVKRVRRQVGRQEAKVHIYPLCHKDWQERIVIEQEAEDA